MNDKYIGNKVNRRPMAFRSIDRMEEDVLRSSWIDRLITNMYIVLSISIVVISIATLSNSSG